MRTSFIINYLVPILLLIGISADAQESESQNDAVIMYLNKGVVLRGDLMHYQPGDKAVLLSKYGDTVEVPEQYLRRIVYKNERSDIVRAKTPYAFRERGFYHNPWIALNANTVSRNSGGITGFELGMVFGYQHKRLLGYGIGVSADFYHPANNEMVFPLFAELRGYILQRSVTPYYTLRAGYGFVFKNEDVGIEGGEGGYMINPAIGWRLSGKKGMNLTLDLGLKFQRATFDTWIWSERALTELTYKRLHVRLGFLF